MRICIISDLHCKYQHDSSSSSDTLLISNKPRIPHSQHPVAAFLHATSFDKNIFSNILLCPGDLGDKADQQGILSSWGFLEEMKSKIGAKLLVAIPGNHDIDSRNKQNNPFDFIKAFHGSFPTDDQSINIKFWESGYAIIIHDNVFILLINTVHDHSDDQKAKQSNISETTLEKLKIELAGQDFKNIKHKICLLHHHPIKHSNIANYTDGDSVEKGDKLLNELVKYQFNLVVHGHKHQPRIVEYNGLTILASGSFSSFANLQGTGIQLMFHIVELDDNSNLGTILSWEFDVIDGWQQKLNKHFPPKIGFGSTANVNDIATQINTLFINNGDEYLPYKIVLDKIPDLNYLNPEKLKQLSLVLRNSFNIIGNPEFPIQPTILNKIIN